MRAAALLASAAAAAAAARGVGSVSVLREVAKKRVERLRADIDGGKFRDATVQTPYGSVTGLADDKVQQFLGVPFAAPPVGDLRWKAPQPPAPWGALEAKWWGPACPQHGDAWTLGVGMNESCLFLNIWAPAPGRFPNVTGPLPVMLFYYGGSWDSGSGGGGGGFLYSGYDALAMDSLDSPVIYVSINYRLNAGGFLASDALRAESPDGSVGNYGFQDQRQALKFVKEVIPGFGGNPNLITIFGESAGAGSVTNHLLSPRSWGLFQRAIMESGPVADWTAQPFNISAQKEAVIAANLGCGALAGAARLACLRNASWQDLLSADNGAVPGNIVQWSPVIDGVEVLDSPKALAAQGRFAPGVPVLLGSNANEGTLFLDGVPQKLNESDYETAMARLVGGAVAGTIAPFYQPSEFSGPTASPSWWAMAGAIGDGEMTCAARTTARWLTGPARAANSSIAPVYTYFFQHEFLVLQVADLFRPLGVCHGSDLINTFNVWEVLLGEGEPALAQMWVRYWTRFAWAGNPNGGTDPAWPAFVGGNATTEFVAVLDTGAGGPSVVPTTELKQARCDWWQANLPVISPDVIFLKPTQ